MTTNTAPAPRFDLLDAIAAVLVAVQLALVIHIALHGAEGRLPIHFGLHGQPDGWADRRYVAVMLGVVAAITFTAHALVAVLRPRYAAVPGARATLLVGRVIGLVTPAAVTAMFAAIGFGEFLTNQSGFLRLIFAVVWLSLAGAGAVVGKAPPNHYSGVRMYWTFHSRLAWDKSNRLLGRIFFLGGLAGLVATPFVDVGPRLLAMAAYIFLLVFGGVAATSYVAWRVWRDDPEKTT